MRQLCWLGCGVVILYCAAGCGSSDTSGSGATSGAGGGTPQSVNGCDESKAEDHTGDATTTIMSNAMTLTYSPNCISIKAGASVTFNSDFAIHPLRGGTFDKGMKTPDASSPITPQTMGTSATFKFPNAGAYGFYCDVHASIGMTGAVFVK